MIKYKKGEKMINKIKQNKKYILELILIFTTTLLFNLICNNMVHDEIWNYGFSYNIATGLIPYKDFNMVITPLFPILGAIFMIIFGKNLVTYHIFNAIICTTIYHYLKKQNSKSYYIPYAILLLYALPNYNLFSMLLLYILITLEEKNSNNYLIGIILGLTFLTKQTIGIFLFIPSLFTKDIKIIVKRIIGFIIPNIFLLIYLIYHNIIFEFIDYTFLGISNFAEKNINHYWSCLIILLIEIIYLIYKYIKTKDIKIIYLLSFQIISFPIVDPYHIMIPLIPTITYFLKNLNLNKKIISITFIIFITTILTYNIYLLTTNEYAYPNDTTVYKYRKINDNVVKEINIIKDYILNQEQKIFIIDMYAYLLKLETFTEINKFDLLNDGNLGKNGEIKIINEIEKICQKEKCIFLLNEIELNNRISQYNKDILNYIDKNYQIIEKIEGLTIYTNY